METRMNKLMTPNGLFGPKECMKKSFKEKLICEKVENFFKASLNCWIFALLFLNFDFGNVII